MTTMELNSELFHQLSYIADDETYMQKVIGYIKSLVVQKTREESAGYITKDEVLNGIESGLKDIHRKNITRCH